MVGAEVCTSELENTQEPLAVIDTGSGSELSER